MSNLDSPPVDEPDATLQPPRFTLRSLLIGTTVVAALLAVLMAVGTAWAVAVLFFAALIAAHVTGNALGTRLRDRAVARPEALPRSRATRRPAGEELAPPTRLSQRRPLHWIILALALLGALVAGYFGGTALAAAYPEVTAAARIMAHVSSGILGGLAVFVVCSFAAVLRHALCDAHAASDLYRPPEWKSNNTPPAKPPAPGESLDRQ